MRVRVLWGIVAVSVLLRVGVAVALGNEVAVLPGIWDQQSYHTLAQRLIGGHGFTFDSLWWPSTPAGEPTAHWSYIYTLMLAALYSVLGVTPLAARLLQAIAAGVLMPWLTYRIAARVFRPAQNAEALGLVAAGWTALYGYFMYYAPALMTESLYLVAVLWVLDCGLRLIERGQDIPVRQWMELGLALALTAMLRQVFLVFAPFLFLWLWLALKPGQRSRLHPGTLGLLVRGGLLTGAVMAGLFAPFTLYNYTQFNRFVLLNTNAGFAFFWANHPVHGDQFYDILPESLGSYADLLPPEIMPLNEAEKDAVLLGRGLQFVADDPARYIRLSLSRIPIYFEFWPAPDSSVPSNITRVASFGLALPFMLVGAALWARDCGRALADWRFGGLLLLFAAVYSLVHILSWSLIRYRLPVDAVMLAFAARALWPLLSAVWPRRAPALAR